MSSRRIGNYQITDYVGGGGFGSVFKAEDINTPGRIVAIKELHKKHTRNQVIKQRFFQEAVAMARLDHPNLPRLYTFGEDNGCYYLVMEFISGKLLSDEIRDSGSIDFDRAVDIVSQVVDAVSYAHKNGIIHRDLKPDNIILVGDAASPRVKVLDFGIARMVGGENLTLAGEGFGTPAYMSPERLSGASSDDPRLDVYSVGIILYEMLAGKAPFESSASDPVLYWAEMRDLHSTRALPPLGPLGVPAELEQVITRATAKRLEHRYQAADEMLVDLKNLSGMQGTAQTVVVSSARLLLSTAPGGAEVYIDDVVRGISDPVGGKIQLEDLSGGLHTVRVLKEGYNEYRINLALEPGRLTNLQVALSARATVAMPSAEDTAAAGLETLKMPAPHDVQTAVLTVENLPAGTALFVGSKPVGHVGEDGRATLKLDPGSHEIRASTPSGNTGVQVVTVTTQDAGSTRSLTIPLGQAAVTSAVTSAVPSGPVGPSRSGKQLAAAAVAILLLSLATAAFFALRGRDRNRTVEIVSVSPSAQPPLDSPSVNPGNPKASEAKSAAGDDKKATERKAAKDDQKEPTAQPPTVPAVTPPAAPATPSPEQAAACLMVTVIDASGNPVPRVRIGVDQPDGGSMPRIGHTGPQGRWRECGFIAGRRVRVAVFGPRGGILGGQQATLSAGQNALEIRLNRSIDEAPQKPERKRPFGRG